MIGAVPGASASEAFKFPEYVVADSEDRDSCFASDCQAGTARYEKLQILAGRLAERRGIQCGTNW